ncbi:DUF2637 domain-containing protein [Kitasatospora griseola]|uniref:DUF2637 domain-containing protein n=1 Tax=Kitasatospora griseola TaxID=2064 RepID=UPI0034487279
MTTQIGPTTTASPLDRLHGLGPLLTGHADLLLGICVTGVAALLILRMWRRVERDLEERKTLSPQELERRDELKDARGRRFEDLLTVLVATAAAGLSSDGLRRLGRNVMHLQQPWDWMPFLALDVAAVVCGIRARRRSRKGQSPGPSGVLVWILAGISSAFSAGEAVDAKGVAARAVWPIVAAVLFELGSIEERLAKAELTAKAAGEWLDRKLRLVRMIHPVEWVRVALALAADERLSQSQATRLVRIDRAAHRLYRLRQLIGDNKTPAAKVRLSKPRIARADRLAQVAQARVPIEDHPAVMAALQRRVRTPEYARINFANKKEVDTALQTRLGDDPGTGAAGTVAGRTTAAGTGTGAATRLYPGTAAGTSGRTHQAASPYPGMPEAGTGTATSPYPGTAGTVLGPYPGTATAGTGTAVALYPGTPGADTGTATSPYPGTATAGTGTADVAPPQPVPAENQQLKPGTAVPALCPSDQPDPEAGTEAGTATESDPLDTSVYEDGTDGAAGTGTAAPGTGGTGDDPAVGTAHVESAPAPGTAGPAFADEAGTGTAAPGTGGTGYDPAAGTAESPFEESAGTASEDRTDEQLALLLFPFVNGTGEGFTVGITKTRELLRVNQDRARRVRELALHLHAQAARAGADEGAEKASAGAPTGTGIDLGKDLREDYAGAAAA